jgi:hypothetical protein
MALVVYVSALDIYAKNLEQIICDGCFRLLLGSNHVKQEW